MRAAVVHGVVSPLVEEDGDHPPLDLEGAALALGDLADLAYSRERGFNGQETAPDLIEEFDRRLAFAILRIEDWYRHHSDQRRRRED